MQYLVIAYDNENALERRLESREAHIEGVKKLISEGKVINAGALIEEEKTTLPDYVMKMIELGMDDMKNGRVYSEEEMDKMDEEWLK